jgi:lipopolysaccharide transport system ATP-binding protein
VRRADGAPADPITTRSPLLIEFEYRTLRPSSGLAVHFNLINQEGTLIFNAGAAARPATATQEVGLFRDVCKVPGDLLNDGTHRIELWIAEGEEVIYRLEDLLSFDVHESPEPQGTAGGKRVGAVRPALQWRTEVLVEGEMPPQRG